MSSLNRGEWSEIYVILSLLLTPDLSIGNAELEEITSELYKLKKIKIDDSSTHGIIEYALNNQDDVQVIFDNELNYLISKMELLENKDRLLNGIINAPVGGGAFMIEGAEDILNKLSKGRSIKANSFSKEDLEATVLDRHLGKDVVLKYSIKSSLGSPATLLNSSQHTNFLYSISGLDDKYINEINSINTRKKLLDRINFIVSHGGEIKFEKVVDETLEYNLKMIDSKMPEYLGNVLLQSYITGKKDLQPLFLESNQFEDSDFALKKLGDFLEGISFGFFPSVKWNGINQVNGGIIIVKNNGNIVILDLNYYRTEVVKYLMNETKLDSPSSSRYHMLELFKSPSDNKIYFTLNLQVRYKR
ncbi:MAG: HpaII family restriction endonuclease [Bacteroidales bacterium]|jgi:hypothetical protein